MSTPFFELNLHLKFGHYHMSKEDLASTQLEIKMSEDTAAPPMDENEKRIVNEFCHLLEKSKQLFNGLR